MKLLILTQKVDINDDILGFMHGWIKEFAKYCEKVTVVCLQKGEYELPENVEVLSLGKEKYINQKSASLLKKLLNCYIVKLLYCWRFYQYIWHYRRSYDNVFVHMNPEYVMLGGWLWKVWDKKIGLWYTHKVVNLKLRMATKLADIVFTASKESFRLKSKKIRVMGHGIDVNRFKNYKLKIKNDEKFKIIYIGRISKIKNQKLLIEAIDILVNQNGFTNLEVSLVGGIVTKEDRDYLDRLKILIRERKLNQYIDLIGSIANKDITKIYNQADLSINLCPTGGLDKAVLESMACEILVIVLNKAFVDILESYKYKLVLNGEDEKELAEKIKQIIKITPKKREDIGKKLRQIVVKDHSLDNLIKKIIKNFNLLLTTR